LERQVSAYKVAAEAVSLSEQEMDRTELLAMLEKEMFEAAEALEFEKAARLRDRIRQIKELPEIASNPSREG
jgi:excinuclease ABC subunit B